VTVQVVAPPATALLEVWEEGRDARPDERALRLLAAACPDRTLEELAALPVGGRDALVLDLRALLFGPDLAAVVSCPRCGEALDVGLTLDDVRLGALAAGEPVRVSDGAYEVLARPPTTADLLALPPGEPGTARRALLDRCASARRDGAAVPARDLPEDVVAAVAERLAAHDPQADVRLALSCPECDHGWEAVLDISAFLWRELDTWADRLLAEVAVLAAAFGWTEPEVLALPPARRRRYLELVRHG
jgi:hypothetical protein